MTFLLFAGGLLALVAGAFILVRGASLLALRLGLSPLVVGLTVVAFGTSAPEMAVTTGAVLAGQGGLAVGNDVGSNIFNVLFVLGLAALITPVLTIVFHVPRNDALAAVAMQDPGAVEAWRHYIQVWTAGNHVRTLSSAAAGLLLTLALRAGWA